MQTKRSVRNVLLVLAAGLAFISDAVAQPDAIEACKAPNGFAALDAVVERSRGSVTPGVALAIICNGQLIHETYAGFAQAESMRPLSKSSVFRLASVTKPVTAAVVLRLAEEGKLSLDDRLSKYLPALSGAEGITLYQLLTHTAGIADFTEDATYSAHKARHHTTAEMIAWIASLKPLIKFPPGTAWAYSNSGYVLLGATIEKVTGTSLQQAYAERLFATAGAASVAFDLDDAPTDRAQGYRRDPSRALAPASPIDMTIPGAAGGLRGTAADFAALADAIFTHRVVSRDSLSRMTKPGVLSDGRPDRWGMPKEWREGLQADYGLGVFIDNKGGRRRWWHTGDIDGFHSWLVHLPDERLTIVLLRNSENGDPMEEAIQEAVLKTLGR